MTLRTVGLNLLFLVPGETGGTEIYARCLLPELAARAAAELVAFVNQETFESPPPELDRPGIELVPLRVRGHGRARRSLAEQLVLPRAVRARGVDVLHSLGSTAPRRSPAVQVVTVHDVIYATHPEAHTRAMRAGMRVLVPLAARGADRLIAISETAAAEIARVLGVPRGRIDVIHLAAREPGAATPDDELRDRHGLGGGPLVLSVSAHRPHKNLGRLLEAFARVDPAALLVLPGYRTPFEDELVRRARALGIADRVLLPGWVSERDLEGLYAAATCFVFPSLAEGFGLPVLEAMRRGVPVACSNASALPEVAGPAARYFDPLDVDGMARAIGELLADRSLAGRLAQAGRERGREFSWERAAEQTFASYERALSDR